MLDSNPEFAAHVDAVRQFNRFYTRRIGLLQKGYLKSAFSLAEMRVLYEIAHRDHPTASEIARDLGLDAGYLSRILAGFTARGLIRKTPAEHDGRQNFLSLTAAGETTYAPLEDRSRQEIAALLTTLPAADRKRTVAAMATIEALLAPTDAPTPPLAPYLLRTFQPGDMGWVVGSQSRFYAEEFDWDLSFEALAADIVAAFIRTYDPRRERCWIAEMDGDPVGSVFVVRHSDEVAKLRLLFVDGKARGRGIGVRLTDECVRFARRSGYAKITLWTQSILTAARRIYAGAGFTLVDTSAHTSFGKDLIGETWELAL
jgi:DNA-binding MarR family transcriptional regulator/GNAT superfamily N-acetyltransferase